MSILAGAIFTATTSLTLAQGLPVVKVPSPNRKLIKSSASWVRFPNTAIGRLANTSQQKRIKDILKEMVGFAEELKRDKVQLSQMPWELEFATTVSVSRRELISYQVQGMSFSGGAHPNHFLEGHTFFVKNGRPSKAVLSDILVGKDHVSFITPILVKELKAQEMEGFEDFQAGKISAEALNNFVITQNGITWLFPQYSVGAYAEGSRVVKLPWSTLAGRVNSRFKI